MPFAATWVDLEIVMLKEVRQRQTQVSLIHGILKNDTNELIYKTETDSHTQKTNYGYQGEEERDNFGFEINIYTLLYTE